jgi:hypothetical protein
LNNKLDTVGKYEAVEIPQFDTSVNPTNWYMFPVPLQSVRVYWNGQDKLISSVSKKVIQMPSTFKTTMPKIPIEGYLR